jgi:ferredoxin
MLSRGIKLNDPLAQRYDGKPTGSGNCGSGGLCRTCAVSVTRGGELLSPPKANEKKMLEETPRWRLACKSWVGYGMKEGDVVVQVNPRQW